MHPAIWIASGGGIGRVRFIPGTTATAIGALIGAFALWIDLRAMIFLAIAACLIGAIAIRLTGEQKSPEWIVVDELAGIWVAMIGLTKFSITGTIGAFIVFRLLSLTRPGPIGWADKREGAIATMADDIAAGLIAAALLYLMRFLPPVLLWGWLPLDLFP